MGLESMQGQAIFLFSKTLIPALWPTQTPVIWYRGLFFQEGGEISLGMMFTTAASAEIKNEWSCTSAPQICLHVMDRDSNTPPFFFALFHHTDCSVVWEGACEC